MSTVMILIGLFLIMAVQFGVFFIATKKSSSKALLCLFVPLYIFVYAKKEPAAKYFLYALYFGLVLLVVGVMLAS